MPAASPTRPLLASTLLSQERDRSQHSQHQWKIGIPSLDDSLPPYLWTSGKVIGIIDDSDSDSASASATTSIPPPEKQHLPLITQLIITHLASSIHNSAVNKSPSPPPSAQAPAPAPAPAAATVFMITPVSAARSACSTTTSSTSPRMLATALESAHLPASSLLDRVSLLQYFDFAGLADAVAEVISCTSLSQVQLDGCCHAPKNSLQQPRCCGDNDSSAAPETQQQPQPAKNPYPYPSYPSILVVLEGLTPTLTTLMARSSDGPVATNALLAPLLRSLTQLSRRRPQMLVVLLLEAEFLDLFSSLRGGGRSSGGGGAAAEELSVFSSYSGQHGREKRRRLRREHGQGRGGFGGGEGNAGEEGKYGWWFRFERQVKLGGSGVGLGCVGVGD
ncbi:hypothetical protein GJ744_006229 [Endocarpon pusillum]|uniref:Uncharacterized protein n=1 Tax=Endocarpon pusillum TaxID=364733 RepID=A0A8H7AM76_9EURO|nr:hypothetical protein GJ744_006229 [Endocarpon pusillum]